METRGLKSQFLSTFVVNILSLGVGASMVWTSPYISLLKSQETPLSTQISSDEASTIGALVPLGALFGALILGWMAEKIGRYWSLYLVSLPAIVSACAKFIISSTFI
jgi:MFS family permease